jgi:hypothetical protein
VKLARTLLPILIISLAGCGKNIQTKEAVREGVVKYLSTRSGLSVSGMEIDIASVNFKGNEAEAMVSFKPKGGSAAAGMQMRYTLEKKGNEWVVKGKADSGSQHGAAAMPEGAAPKSDLPPDHPPMGPGTMPGAKK